MPSVEDAGVRPIVRWAGGKRWLVPHLKRIATLWSPVAYHEPFAGGAASFFGYPWPDPHLSDVNDDLMAMYRGIRVDFDLVRRRVQALPHNRETFDIVKTSRPRSDVARAVRMLYLNRLAYGGIYRTDRAGRYNVPYSGDRTTASLCEGDRLKRTGEALRRATVATGDFEDTLSTVVAGAFVYCDPVYALPEPEKPGPFNRYAAGGFSWGDQRRLAAIAHELKDRGALVIVSNALDDRVTRLFAPDLTVAFDRRAPLPKAQGKSTREAVHVIGHRDVVNLVSSIFVAGKAG